MEGTYVFEKHAVFIIQRNVFKPSILDIKNFFQTILYDLEYSKTLYYQRVETLVMMCQNSIQFPYINLKICIIFIFLKLLNINGTDQSKYRESNA